MSILTPSKFKTYETIIYSLICIFSLVYINLKSYGKKSSSFTILLSNVVFLILLKITGFFALYFTNSEKSVRFDNIKEFQFFNFYTMIYFICITLISVLVTYLFNENIFFNIKPKYNIKISTIILIGISFMFIVIYSLIPNKLYFLSKLIIFLLNGEIVTVNKNIIFITINNWLIIPNIGLGMLIVLIIRNSIKIKNKFKSLFLV